MGRSDRSRGSSRDGARSRTPSPRQHCVACARSPCAGAWLRCAGRRGSPPRLVWTPWTAGSKADEGIVAGPPFVAPRRPRTSLTLSLFSLARTPFATARSRQLCSTSGLTLTCTASRSAPLARCVRWDLRGEDATRPPARARAAAARPPSRGRCRRRRRGSRGAAPRTGPRRSGASRARPPSPAGA